MCEHNVDLRRWSRVIDEKQKPAPTAMTSIARSRGLTLLWPDEEQRAEPSSARPR